MNILIPKRHLRDDAFRSAPVFFLAGPIRGGGDWQTQVCKELAKHEETVGSVIACPSRWDKHHELAEHFLDGDESFFARQLDWETHYLAEAGLRRPQGCILFWLPCESTSSPHPGPEPYAMDTRGELGEWRARMELQDARVVIGAEPSFLGLSQIQRNADRAAGESFPIYQSIEGTVAAAIERSRGMMIV